MSERYLFFFTKEIAHHFDLNESKGVCNFSVLVIRTSDMESRSEEA